MPSLSAYGRPIMVKSGTSRVVILPERERRQRRSEVAQSFINDFGATADQAAALRDLHLPTGWEPFSMAALQRFMPRLEAGDQFGALLNGTDPKWEKWRAQNL